jgi:hypothetical protein
MQWVFHRGKQLEQDSEIFGFLYSARQSNFHAAAVTFPTIQVDFL